MVHLNANLPSIKSLENIVICFSSVYLITLLNVFISYMFSYVYLWNYKSTLWTCDMTRRTQQNKKISILPLWLNEKVCRINHFYLYIDCCHCMTAIGKPGSIGQKKNIFEMKTIKGYTRFWIIWSKCSFSKLDVFFILVTIAIVY